MKKNAILALSLVVILTMLILPVSAANKWEYRANGQVTEYDAVYYDDPPSAMVVNGNWNLRVVDGTVDFQLSYTEMNLISESENGAPVGSIDLFKITAYGTGQLEIANGVWITTDTFNVDKLATQPDGSKFWRYGINVNKAGTIHIAPNGRFTLDMGAWHLIGSMNSLPRNIPPFLEGQRLYLIYPPEVSYLSASEPFYVCHGVRSVLTWKETSPAEKAMFLNNGLTYNELYIDGVQVDLRPWHHIQAEGFMLKVWYIQFDANSFVADSEHSFHILWYENGVLIGDATTVVHFDS